MSAENVDRILQWPPETWSEEEKSHVNQRRVELHAEMFSLNAEAERRGRNLTPQERETFDRLQAEYGRLSGAVPSQR